MELLFGEEFDRNDDEPPVASSESGTGPGVKGLGSMGG